MHEIYAEFFPASILPVTGEKGQKEEGDPLLQSIERKEIQAMQDELVRQRDFLSKKLATITIVNKRGESERDDAYLRVQIENTNLIKECNLLRKTKQILKGSVNTLFYHSNP